jgi:hypothetical protein
MFNRAWRLWAKALGEKAGNSDREADIVAIIRTAVFISVLITNMVIIAGNLHRW